MAVLVGLPKGDKFIESELDSNDYRNGEEFGNAFCELNFVNSNPKNHVAQAEPAHTDTQEDKKALNRFILHLEIDATIQCKTGTDADKHGETVCQEKMQPQQRCQNEKNSKIERCGEHADDSVENQLAEL